MSVPTRPTGHPRLHRGLLALGLGLALMPGAAVAQGASLATSPDAPDLRPLSVGLGYIPSVQFAPFYLAEQAGYYEAAGLDVEFQNKIDPDLITLVGQGSIDVGIADGTSVIPAVSQGIPIRYVATIYGQFPSIVFSKASSGIATPASMSSSRTRSTRTSSRSSARARSTSGSATGRASSRRSATASQSPTSRRSTASSRTSSSPRRRPGSRPRLT